MGSLWRDSVHGALSQARTSDTTTQAHRATALLLGVEPVRAMSLMRSIAPLARVRIAADLHSAMSLALDLQPDLLLLGDDIDGVDIATVLEIFQSRPTLDDIPVIVLASQDGNDSELDALRGGALSWLPHSVDGEALRARVRLAVRMHRSLHARQR